MIYAFAFALVLGGILLGASLLVGDGHGDLGGHGDLHVGGDTVDAIVGTLRSLRFWTFFLAFFGLSGVLLQTLGIIESSFVAAILATAAGLGAGWFATWAFRKIDTKESNSVATAEDFVGKTGRILVAVAPGQLGKIRVQAKGTLVDLLAESEDERFAVDEEAIVIEMDGTTARIARVETGDERAPRGD